MKLIVNKRFFYTTKYQLTMFLYVMGKVVEIGITDTKGGRFKKVSVVDAFKGKGILNDRKFCIPIDYLF